MDFYSFHYCSAFFSALPLASFLMRIFKEKIEPSKHSWKKLIIPLLLADNLGTTKKDFYMKNQAVLSINQQFGPIKTDF